LRLFVRRARCRVPPTGDAAPGGPKRPAARRAPVFSIQRPHDRPHTAKPASRGASAMKSLILESDPSLPLIHISLAAPNGASQDPDGKEGLCRLTLRLMRRTAGGKPAEQVDAELDRLGGALGVDVGCSSAGFSGSLLRRSLSPYLELLRDAL